MGQLGVIKGTETCKKAIVAIRDEKINATCGE
jgi:hypothetical protein